MSIQKYLVTIFSKYDTNYKCSLIDIEKKPYCQHFITQQKLLRGSVRKRTNVYIVKRFFVQTGSLLFKFRSQIKIHTYSMRKMCALSTLGSKFWMQKQQKKSHPIIKKREDIVQLLRRFMFNDIIKLRKGNLTTVMQQIWFTHLNYVSKTLVYSKKPRKRICQLG